MKDTKDQGTGDMFGIKRGRGQTAPGIRPTAHRPNTWPDGQPFGIGLTPLATSLSLLNDFREGAALRALLSDMACFRDRYFEILAYLLTVLAEILRSSAMVLCGYPAAFML